MNTEQRETIRKDFVQFNGNLVASDEFFDILRERNFLTEADVDEITSKGTQRARNREFLSIIQRKSTYAFDGLYDALLRTQQYALARILKPDIEIEELVPEPYPLRNRTTQPSDSDQASLDTIDQPTTTTTATTTVTTVAAEAERLFSDDDTFLDETNRNVDDIRLRLESTLKSVKGLFFSDGVYRMSTVNRGIRGRCLIINNVNFEMKTSRDQASLDERPGSGKDQDNITKVLKQLKFALAPVETNVTKSEFLQKIKTETEHPDHEKYGMFVLVIMSHGSEQEVYGSDSRPVQLKDIYSQIGPYKFPHMAGKPKWVIIQACSGNDEDTLGYSGDGARYEEDTPRPPASQLSPQVPPTPPPPTPEVAPVPVISQGQFTAREDFIIMRASFSGYKASRHGRQGTWFIRALVEALYKHSCHAHLLEIFEQVQRKVSSKSKKARNAGEPVGGQDPLVHSHLYYKRLYLFPGYNPTQPDTT